MFGEQQSQSSSKAAAPIATTLWGLYCACSWTWCIGMFLPTVLLHRYGWPGFFVFALPNVLGCTAFGYVLKTRQRSLELVERHRWMMVAFSAVTIAYQLFFAGFITMRLGRASEAIELQPALVALGGVFVVGTLTGALGLRWWPILAAAVYAVSLAAFGAIGTGAADSIQWFGQRPWYELGLLTPTICFGFLLCPYLDLTFHRALQSSPSRHAFGVFGVTFAVMIVLTCTYWLLSSEPADAFLGGNSLAQRLLVAHLFTQLTFTVAVHMREMRMAMAEAQPPTRLWIQVAPLAVALLLAAAAALKWSYATNEAMYLRFLVFYGLVFPAYVLTFIGPWRIKRMTIMNFARLAIAVIAFMPLYELGFIQNWAGLTVVPVVFFLLWVWGTAGAAQRE